MLQLVETLVIKLSNYYDFKESQKTVTVDVILK